MTLTKVKTKINYHPLHLWPFYLSLFSSKKRVIGLLNLLWLNFKSIIKKSVILQGLIKVRTNSFPLSPLVHLSKLPLNILVIRGNVFFFFVFLLALFYSSSQSRGLLIPIVGQLSLLFIHVVVSYNIDQRIY